MVKPLLEVYKGALDELDYGVYNGSNLYKLDEMWYWAVNFEHDSFSSKTFATMGTVMSPLPFYLLQIQDQLQNTPYKEILPLVAAVPAAIVYFVASDMFSFSRKTRKYLEKCSQDINYITNLRDRKKAFDDKLTMLKIYHEIVYQRLNLDVEKVDSMTGDAYREVYDEKQGQKNEKKSFKRLEFLSNLTDNFRGESLIWKLYSLGSASIALSFKYFYPNPELYQIIPAVVVTTLVGLMSINSYLLSRKYKKILKKNKLFDKELMERISISYDVVKEEYKKSAEEISA